MAEAAPKRRRNAPIEEQVNEHTKMLKQHSSKRDQLLIPSGSTMLNLACSDNPFGAYGVGKMANLIGDSSTGKTLVSLTMMAEMAQSSKWDKFEFILDDVEAAQGGMNLANMFGKRAASRIRSPLDSKGKPKNSERVLEFFSNVGRALKSDSPFIYVLDSFDAISTEEDGEALDKLVKTGELDGSYDMNKQKVSSKMLAEVCAKIEKHGSYLHIVSQTRENIGARPGQSKLKRSGGKALKFYAWHEIWLGKLESIKDPKYKRVLGAEVRARVTKNRETGKVRDAEFPVYVSYGVDDIVSCIDFMVDAKKWATTKHGNHGTFYHVPGICEEEGLPLKQLIATIEGDKLMADIREMVGAAWTAIEEEIVVKRQPKFL